MGCFSIFVGAFVALVLLLGGIWFIYIKTVDALTQAQPIAIQLEPPSPEQFAAANRKLEEVRTAARERRSVTVEFTAADLNALFALHPDFDDANRRMRVAIADSLVTLNLSAPLHWLQLPRMKRRWFNGTAVFGFAYDNGDFNFDLRSITANDRTLPTGLVRRLAGWFTTGFNEGFNTSMREHGASSEFWNDVRSARVEGDKLMVTTKGGTV